MPLSNPFGRSGTTPRETLFSSFTDNGVFPSSCREIAKDDRRFEEFRREATIVRAMEHVSSGIGQAHLDSILDCCPDALELYLEAARKNDKVGKPVKCGYEPFGSFSPKTLEYVRIAHDLKHIFGDLSGFEVLEIGGGYGGQALVLSSLFDLQYTILDLPEVLHLQRRFHLANEISNVTYDSASDQLQSPIARPSNLLISNYAFTECRKEVQRTYLRTVLAYADRGYMACNFVMKSRRNLPMIGKYELLRSLEGSRYVDERPELYVENRVLLWDRSTIKGRRSRGRAMLEELRRDGRAMPKRQAKLLGLDQQ